MVSRFTHTWPLAAGGCDGTLVSVLLAVVGDDVAGAVGVAVVSLFERVDVLGGSDAAAPAVEAAGLGCNALAGAAPLDTVT